MTSTGGEPTLIYYIGTPKRIVKRKNHFLSKSCGGGLFLYWHLQKQNDINIGGYMKKIFLLVASFVFSAHAINCIEAFSISNYGGSKKFDNTYTLDSTQSINGSDLSGFYYAHTTFNRDKNGAIESVTRCTDECNTLSYKEVITQNDADNSITTNTYIDNHLTASETYFPEKDSTVAIQYSEIDDMEAMLISYTVNDTIYGLQYFYDVYEGEGKFELMNSYYIALDSIDSSICYQYSLKNNPMSKYWIEKTDSSMTFFYSRIYDDEFVGKYYFSKIGSEGTTSLNHKIHPAIVNKKFQLFDLMGRPAKQKQHIIKVVK